VRRLIADDEVRRWLALITVETEGAALIRHTRDAKATH
jgi:hypothetical protein